MSTYNDLKEITFNWSGLTGDNKIEKPKRISRKKRIEDLEQSVRELGIKIEDLRMSLTRKTSVYTPFNPLSLSFFGPQKPTPKTVYAAEAIKLIANHLGIRFNDIAPKNIVEPIPPPVEHDYDDYDDEA